jgi:hypothetical protein
MPAQTAAVRAKNIQIHTVSDLLCGTTLEAVGRNLPDQSACGSWHLAISILHTSVSHKIHSRGAAQLTANDHQEPCAVSRRPT